MAHYAQIDEYNIVTQVIVVSNDVEGQNLPYPQSEPFGVAFCRSLFGNETVWAQTSYNGAFRYNYAGIGYMFDSTVGPYGAFIPPQPFPSWLLDTSTYRWTAPVQYPSDGTPYVWDEAAGVWAPMQGMNQITA